MLFKPDNWNDLSVHANDMAMLKLVRLYKALLSFSMAAGGPSLSRKRLPRRQLRKFKESFTNRLG